MSDSISMNHGVKFQVLLENFRKRCHYFVELTDLTVCSRVVKHNEDGRTAFMQTACNGNIENCQLTTAHLLGESNGLEAWHPEAGAIPQHNEPEGSKEV